MRLRHHWLARVAVVLLLGWTVADLGVDALCASESVDRHATAQVGQVDLASCASAQQTAAEDCFCCSHSVQPVTTLPVVVLPVQIDVVNVTAAGAGNGAPSELDHPPQA